MKLLLIGLITLSSLSAFANPYSEECEKTALKAELATEIATAEGEGAKLLSELGVLYPRPEWNLCCLSS